MILGIGNKIPLTTSRAGGGGVAEKFTLEVNISNPGDTIVIGSATGGGRNTDYNVDWGDGNSDGNVTANATHTYAAAGTYEIKIDGTLSPFHWKSDATFKTALTKLKNWGNTTTTFEQIYYMIDGFTNFVYETSDTDYPNIQPYTPTASFQYFMYNAINNTYAGTLNLNDWNLESISGSLSRMLWGTFRHATGVTLTNKTLPTSSLPGAFLYFGLNITPGEGDINVNNISLPNISASSPGNIFQGARGINNVNNWTLPAAGNSSLYRAFFDTHVKAGVTSLDLSGWSNTAGVTTLQETFRKVRFYDPGSPPTLAFGTLNLTGWDLSSVANCYFMFYQANITDIIGLSNFTFGSNLASTDVAYMFAAATKMSFNTHDFPATGFFDDLGNCTHFLAMFYQCGKDLTGADVSKIPNGLNNIDTSGATSLQQMFQQANFSSALDMSWFDLSSVTTLNKFMAQVKGTTTADFSTCGITNSLTNMGYLFYYNQEITSVSFGSGTSANDYSGVTTWDRAFQNTPQLTSVEFPTNTSFASVTASGMTNFLVTGTMADAEYNNLLVRFEATNSINPGGAFRVNAYFSLGTSAEAARTALIARGWTFTDLGGR
tara:strand:- start:341 stop:2149 length:1809 start_codon:yes stop_codon:yes gene_type:complete